MLLQNNEAKHIKDKINEYAVKNLPFFFVVNYELTEGVFVDNPLEQDQVYFMFNALGNKPQRSLEGLDNTLRVFPMGVESYKAKFDTAYKALKSGSVKVINLTERTPVDPGMSLEDIFAKSTSPYQIYLPGRFVCFSPERFVRISEDGTISSNPMKGTIDASLPDAERLVLDNPKEIAEHTATAQLIVDELSVVASDVTITRFRYIDRIESRNRTLLQVSSEVVGKLGEDFKSRMGDIIFDLLPAGSIAGTPRMAALDAIKNSEGEPRGYYCGIAGYFDGKTLDTAVLIRYIEFENDKFYFRSGGGVTIDSVLEKEYQEVLNKIYLPF